MSVKYHLPKLIGNEWDRRRGGQKSPPASQEVPAVSNPQPALIPTPMVYLRLIISEAKNLILISLFIFKALLSLYI